MIILIIQVISTVGGDFNLRVAKYWSLDIDRDYFYARVASGAE